MSDLLQIYMNQVKCYPLLSKEEELALAVRYVEEEDEEASQKLVASNLRLVVTIAFSYPKYHDVVDLIQEGTLGLIQAVRKYDPYKGVKLSTPAGYWIRAYMLQYIMSNHRLVKLGTGRTQRKLFWNLEREKAKLETQGIKPTNALLADRLGVPEKAVASAGVRFSLNDKSLDAPITDEGRLVPLVELTPSEDPPIDEVIMDRQILQQRKTKLHAFSKTLGKAEKKIYEERWMSEDPKTLLTIGEELGVSRQRAHQYEVRLRKRLKDYMKKV